MALNISREYCLRSDRGRAAIVSKILRGTSEVRIAHDLGCTIIDVYEASQAFLHKWRNDGLLITTRAALSLALRNWAMTAPGIEGGTAE